MARIRDIIQSPLFARQKKKLQKNQKKDLDTAVKLITEKPELGNVKTGDLKGIRIHKFKSQNAQILLAYEKVDDKLYLYALSSHQNFYRELKKYLQT